MPVPSHSTSSAHAPSTTTPPQPPLSITDINRHYAKACRTLKELGPVTFTAQWIKPQANNGQGKFFTVTLADTKTPSISMQGIIWDTEEAKNFIATGITLGVNLLDRQPIEVIIEGTLEFWTKQSKPYIAIKKLSRTGMLGLKHQQRQQALEKLQAQNLIDRNKALPWAIPTLRIVLITKDGSDAHRDAVSILSKSPYQITIDLIPVSVQGIGAVDDIQRAFQHLQGSSNHYDAVLLIRGGGGELDLLAYDNYLTASAVAECPIPCITGIGHQADHSLCDVVSYRKCETPTAASQFIVTQLNTLAHHIDQTRQSIAAKSLQYLARHQQRLQLLDQGIKQCLPQLMQHHQHYLETLTRTFRYALTRQWTHWQQTIQETLRTLEPFSAQTWKRLGITMARSLEGHIIAESINAPHHIPFWLYFADQPLLVTRTASLDPPRKPSEKSPHTTNPPSIKKDGCQS